MDGTLTPPRLPMTEAFAKAFSRWQQSHKNYIATGSDYHKVTEQLPQNVIDSFSGIYSSMGNVLTHKKKTIYQKEFKVAPKLYEMLEDYRLKTAYPYKLYPNYIEKRMGMINFSVLGRNCPYEERLKYAEWDKKEQEREKIASELRRHFIEYDISVGGSISMDITPKGCGKGQIAHHLRSLYPNEKIVFFGDKTFVGGNDYELLNCETGLSVDGVSISYNSCWNYALHGMRNLEATNYYLDLITIIDRGLFVIKAPISKVKDADFLY